jgi:hypothetical protein
LILTQPNRFIRKLDIQNNAILTLIYFYLLFHYFSFITNFYQLNASGAIHSNVTPPKRSKIIC